MAGFVLQHKFLPFEWKFPYLAGARNLHAVREARDRDDNSKNAEQRPGHDFLRGPAVAVVRGERRNDLERHEGAGRKEIGKLREEVFRGFIGSGADAAGA